MSKIKRFFIFLLVLCVAAIPLFSCGENSDENGSSKSEQTQESSVSTSKDDALSKLSSALEEMDSSVKNSSKSSAANDTPNKDSSTESSSSNSDSVTENTSSTATSSSVPSAVTPPSSSVSSDASNAFSSASTSNDGESGTISNGSIRNCVNVLDYGAKPDEWGVDDTDAFLAAIATGKSVYVPAGYYFVSQGLKLRNQNLYGDGMYQTFIISTTDNLYMPVLSLGRTASVEDLTIGFKTEIITGEEQWIQRIGIITGDDYESGSWCLQRGSQINRVGIADVGTGICSCDLKNREGFTSFSVSYTNLEIRDFSYRGIDFTSETRTGNVFSNIYMNSKYTVDCLFNMEGEESETSITQLNLEHTKVKRAAMSLVGCRALAISTLHIEGILLSAEDSAYIYLANTSGSMEAVSVYYSAVDANYCSLIKIGDAVYDINAEWQTDPPAVLSKLRIGTLHLKGLHDPNEGIHGTDRPFKGLNDLVGFKFIKRVANAKGNYKVTIDNYVYFSFQSDWAKYTEFARESNVTVVSDQIS